MGGFFFSSLNNGASEFNAGTNSRGSVDRLEACIIGLIVWVVVNKIKQTSLNFSF